ncbi:uncharacterized protein LOC115695542 [Cannabis sativa]|nr:uncharacterized protein LOC115695542 [Cannabis sativa]
MAIAASGHSIDLWTQPWIPWMSYMEFTLLMNGLNRRHITARTIADISIDGVCHREIVLQIFGDDLGGRILDIPRISTNHSGQIVWRDTQNGRFSVKCAYFANQKYRFKPVRDLWKMIWKPGIHPRVAIFMWQVLNGAIPTRDKLGFILDKECLFCGDEMESCIHLFRDCNVIKNLWIIGEYPIYCTNVPGETMQEYVENLVSIFPTPDRSSVINYMGYLFSAVWAERNKLLYKGSSVFLPLLLQQVAAQWKDFCISASAADPPGSTVLNPCRRVSNASIVLMTDASWKEGAAGLAAVVINGDTGRWAMRSEFTTAYSTLEAETKAVFWALQWASSEGWQEIHVLSDSLVVTQALNQGRCIPDWRFLNLSLSILDLIKGFVSCSLFYVNRSELSFVDGLAKNARISSVNASVVQGEGIPPVVPIFRSS